MAPLRGPRPRSTQWQVAMAHGHYEPPETRANPLRPSWIFGDEEIAATGADYLALGHWDRPMRVGNGVVPAFYSGSPELARTVNLVRLTAGEVIVTPDAKLSGDLNAESIDYLDITFQLEKAFGIKIPKGELIPENMFTDPEFVAWWQRLEEMRDKKCWNNDMNSQQLYQGQQAFVQGKAAMTVSAGTAVPGFVKQVGVGKVGLMAMPTFRIGPYAGRLGATSQTVGITRWSKYPTVA